MLTLLASGYDETFEPIGGWKAAKEDERTIVLAGEEIFVAEIPTILADREWAIPIINFIREAQNHGCPWGANVGWLDWPVAYREILTAVEDADAALKERT